MASIRTVIQTLAVGAILLAPMQASTQIGTREKTATQEAESIVTEPLEDTNIQRRKIPDTLTRISGQPYSLAGLKTCAQLASAVTELDGVLGPDVDAPAQTRDTTTNAISVAGDVVGSFIPGRGLVRELTGANKAKHEYDMAVYAGLARRAFLKGVGAQRGCKPPAAPAAAL